jgi:hypothetical protein
MTAAVDPTPTRTDATDRVLLRSPGLGQFRKAPFRLLRLSPNATAKQAVWQSDKALARARVGMALPDPDPVPWLPPGDAIEIQEAAQIMESPLARMVEQLLWFDPAEDADGAALLEALVAADGGRLHAYLEAEHARSIAGRINEANLHLLLGFSRLYEVGPALVAAGEAARPVALAWKTTGGLSSVEDPHKAVRPAATLLGAGVTWAELLGEGVSAWGALLASPELADHVRGKIAALGDELLTADDLEAVLSGLRTRIADLVVGETKLEITQGRIDNVSQLSAIAGRSTIDAETWLVAFRPLKTQFQAELDELAPDAETGLGVVEDVSAYLDRLRTLAQRWRPIDEAQLLGLSALIDDAAQLAFARLRGASHEIQLGTRFSEVLARIGQIAQSPSFKERIKGYTERLVDVSRAMCHFCGRRELEAAYCAAVSSRVEVSREQYGNTIRVQYKVGTLPVGRCKRCALQHGFIRGTGTIAFIALATSVLLLAIVHPSTWFSSVELGPGIALAGVGIVVAFVMAMIVREVASVRLTPKGERKFGDYLVSYAVERMRSDGFYEFKYDSRPNAWERVNVHGAKHPASGGLDSISPRSWVYIGAAILFIALRFCGGK